MRYFANGNSPFLWGWGQHCVHDENEFAQASCPTTAKLSGISNRIVLPERVSDFLEGFQVLDCPLNLEARAIERLHSEVIMLPSAPTVENP